MSPSVLYERLSELTVAGLVGRDGGAYRLTDLGAGLGAALEPLEAWATRWARRAPR
jgi:DNA-binding HxlR family transcriptional regulator